jgi:hypothetical protein
MIIGFITHISAQDRAFTTNANAFIIRDSTITTNHIIRILIQNGYLIRNVGSSIIETEYKSFKRDNMYISMLFNFIDGNIYIRGNMRIIASPEGDETFHIRNAIGFKDEFNHIYNLLKQIKPDIVIEAVVL